MVAVDHHLSISSDSAPVHSLHTLARVFWFVLLIFPVLIIAVSVDTQNLPLQTDWIGMLILDYERILSLRFNCKEFRRFFLDIPLHLKVFDL